MEKLQSHYYDNLELRIPITVLHSVNENFWDEIFTWANTKVCLDMLYLIKNTNVTYHGYNAVTLLYNCYLLVKNDKLELRTLLEQLNDISTGSCPSGMIHRLLQLIP